jgi:hypothetical protein
MIHQRKGFQTQLPRYQSTQLFDDQTAIASEELRLQIVLVREAVLPTDHRAFEIGSPGTTAAMQQR